MFKLTSLILGFLIVISAPTRSQSATLQNQSTPQRINPQLHVQKLIPIKKSLMLRTTVIDKTPADNQPEPSPAAKEAQPIKSVNQRDFDDRNRFGSNERPITILNNSPNANGLNSFGNFSNVNR
jgi:hypothetical protein